MGVGFGNKGLAAPSDSSRRNFLDRKNVKNAVKLIFSDWQKEASFLEQIFNKASEFEKEGCKVGLLFLPAAQ